MNPGAFYVPKVQRSLADMNHGLRYEDVLNALGGEMQINQLVNGMKVRLATPHARAALLGNTRHRRLCAIQSDTTRLGPLSTLCCAEYHRMRRQLRQGRPESPRANSINVQQPDTPVRPVHAAMGSDDDCRAAYHDLCHSVGGVGLWGAVETLSAPLTRCARVASAQCMNAFFICDIALQFFLPYQDANGQWVKSKSKMARRYARTWLTIDIISVLPIDVFVVSKALEVRSFTGLCGA
eukprot:634279-Prymnesium_polylepis.1